MKLFSAEFLKYGMQHHSWFRPYATSRQVVGSIPDEANEFFN
jgi:hypothetical protein